MKHSNDVQNILSQYGNTDMKFSKVGYSIAVCIFLSHKCVHFEKNIMYKKCSMLNRY